MEMNGEYRIAAPRAEVWAALNDENVLKACIPGCQTLEKTSDTSFSATVQAKVGPVKAKFKGAVTLSNIDAPNGYTITGEGKGGAAGFGKGGADIKLTDADGGTLLSYTATASVGGKMAQIGSRLIDSTAKKLASEFFAKFNELVSEPSEDETDTPVIEEAATEAEAEAPTPATPDGPAKEASAEKADTDGEKQGLMRPGILIPVAILAVVIIYFLSKGA